MESGELLPSSPASSTTPTSSSAPSVASAVSKSSLSTGAASLSSTASPCVLEAGKSKIKVSPDSVSEWWRTTDGHSRAGTPFFPPLLGIPPLFAPPAQNHDSSFHSRTSGKSSRNGPEKGTDIYRSEGPETCPHTSLQQSGFKNIFPAL